jgi:hypothetical protein
MKLYGCHPSGVLSADSASDNFAATQAANDYTIVNTIETGALIDLPSGPAAVILSIMIRWSFFRDCISLI